ncbi:MAG: hypothetical protein GX262_01250 [Clostridia bacterium]|jgi:hypothetical protein|nr:hypothetical protein [Clostridia bacterium]
MEQNMSALLIALVAYGGVFVVLGFLVFCISGLRLVDITAEQKNEINRSR